MSLPLYVCGQHVYWRLYLLPLCRSVKCMCKKIRIFSSIRFVQNLRWRCYRIVPIANFPHSCSPLASVWTLSNCICVLVCIGARDLVCTQLNRFTPPGVQIMGNKHILPTVAHDIRCAACTKHAPAGVCNGWSRGWWSACLVKSVEHFPPVSSPFAFGTGSALAAAKAREMKSSLERSLKICITCFRYCRRTARRDHARRRERAMYVLAGELKKSEADLAPLSKSSSNTASASSRRSLHLSFLQDDAHIDGCFGAALHFLRYARM